MCVYFSGYNYRYLSDEKPQLFNELLNQLPQKLNLRAGVYDDCIVGPFSAKKCNRRNVLFLFVTRQRELVDVSTGSSTLHYPFAIRETFTSR